MTGITFTDLENLDPPQIVDELDYEALLAAIRADLLARFPDVEGLIDLESEPARYLIEAVAYRELLLRARVNDAVRANMLAFAGGSDLDHLAAFYDVVRLAGESDEALRRRTVLAIAGRSPGGTAPRYRSVALGADIRVADAIAWRDDLSPVVQVAVFATDNGGMADAALLEAVRVALNDPAVRMVNDTIAVRSAVTTTVDVEADIWLLPETPNSVFDVLEETLREAWARESGLGFDMTRSWLTARLMVSGVHRVDIRSPAQNIVLPPFEAARFGTITLNNAGRDY
ncbi:baseplate assembly protein [Kaustia mangrovi]|uniref:baseplate assembly protein n=1 Tax=Kaustia mangrovi TaxID=2593653 RepID=UPI001FECA078|nr:baseplate J/gp47 family protein [Kaustia mangrovi]